MSAVYTHSLVGLGLARLYANRPMPWTFWTLAAALPVIPDLDAFSRAAYGTMLGHRGITHSLVFGLALSVVTAATTFRHFRVRWWSLACLLFAIMASHGLLDAMTIGGEGIPFFWPLGSRYGNWGPVHACDMTLRLPNARYLPVVWGEMLWVWLPMALAVGLVMTYRRCKRHPATTEE